MKIMNHHIPALALLLAAALVLGSFQLVLPMAARADEDEQLASSEIKNQLEELEKEQAENQAQIDYLESLLQENLSEMEDIVLQKSIIDQEIFILHSQVRNTNEMIAAYNVLIADKQRELNEAEDRLQTLNALNKERIRAMEEDGALSYWAVLFKANSFSDLLDRLNMIEEIAAADARRLELLREAAAQVELAQAELVTEKENLEVLRQELAETEAQLQGKRVEADQLLADLIATGEEYELYMEEAEDRQQQTMQDIANKEQELEDALASESYSRWLEESFSIWIEESIQESIEESKRLEEEANKPPYVPPVENWTPSYSGDWRSPLNESSWVTSPYGMRLHPIYNYWRMHHGVDLESYFGQEIVSARDGYVCEVGYEEGGAGYYVWVDHGDGFKTVYMHMTYFVVEKGDTVYAGDLLGYVGSTGASTGPHLHFGVYYYGGSVNPCDYVDFS